MLYALSYLLELTTPTWLIVGVAISGVLVSGALLKLGYRGRRFAAINLAILGTCWILVKALPHALPWILTEGQHELQVETLSLHFNLLIACYLFSAVTSWAFWTHSETVTLELFAVATTLVWILSGHRNYFLDAPRQLATLAWEWGVAPQNLLIGIGLVALLSLMLYALIASKRTLLISKQPLHSAGRFSSVTGISLGLLFLALLGIYVNRINLVYEQNLSRATNGVGQTPSSEDASPLGFHSATGKTKQPAALVRLESDFDPNPWSPMLYIREGALSKFSGRELVFADSRFDGDTPRIKPGALYKREKPLTLLERKPLTQSVYLLANHDSVFAVDYPSAIHLLKNPDPDRFKLAYQAESLAPSVALTDLLALPVGDESWSEEEWDHYLRAPGSNGARTINLESFDFADPVLNSEGEDLRYRAYAQLLTQRFDSLVARAAVISQYLSKESIYTRAPGHTVEQNGDPVAPYLFSEEKRGYCVHFAHAAVFLMRLAGVPARIGTGYLTDLTYAKDGHILLHLGDRHAWPEIYIQGHGWVVVDITPQQAENESVIIPDEKLLEDLMSSIDPAEIIAESEVELQASSETDSGLIHQFSAHYLGWIFAIGILLSALAKGWLLYSYKFKANPSLRARMAYRAFAARLLDRGEAREIAETPYEYAKRLNSEKHISFDQLRVLRERAKYAQNGFDCETVDKALEAALASYSRANPAYKRALGFVNPRSLISSSRL